MNNWIEEKNQKILLQIARQALENQVRFGKRAILEPSGLDAALLQEGASFVTLHQQGRLRGCIGTLFAHQPLYLDVAEHAIAAGTQDFRFSPVTAAELENLSYEVSVLSKPQALTYADSDDLLRQLTPQVHGVVLQSGAFRATFLPQVWQSVPEKEEFLGQLCLKMGLPRLSWRKKHLDVAVYTVQEFSD